MCQQFFRVLSHRQTMTLYQASVNVDFQAIYTNARNLQRQLCVFPLAFFLKKTFDYLDLVAEYSKPADPLSPPGETEVRGVFLRVVESLKYGQVTPEEAAEQFVQEANSILN